MAEPLTSHRLDGGQFPMVELSVARLESQVPNLLHIHFYIFDPPIKAGKIL